MRREEKKEEREEECIDYNIVFAHEERGTRRRNLQEHQGDESAGGSVSIRRKRSVFDTGDLMWREVSKEVPIDTHIKQCGGS